MCYRLLLMEVYSVKKLLTVFALLLSTVLFGMQQLAMKPMVQVAAVAAMPAIKQVIRNYSGNTSTQYAMQPYDYEGIFPYNPSRDNECIRSCIMHDHDNLVGLGDYSYEQKLQNANECITSMNKIPDTHVYVVRTNGQSVGYIWYVLDKYMFANHAYIAQRGVLQDYRGLGLGKKLMNHVEQKCWDDPDLTVIELKKTKPILQDVYFKMGYQNTTPEGARLFTYQKRLRCFSLKAKKVLGLGAGLFVGLYGGSCLYEKRQSVESDGEFIDQQLVEV